MRGSVTDSKLPPESPEPDPSDEFDAFEDDDDLEDLERLGVDGVVAQMTGGKSATRRRPPWISLLVMFACVYPLYSMFGDFSFWLQSNEPIPVGDAADLFEDGAMPSGLDNRYIRLDGTPDVQWATVLTKQSGSKVSYLRVVEGGGRMFAAVPRPEAKSGQTPQYPSQFVGRVTRFGDAHAFDWVAKLFAQERVTQLHDVTAEALAEALAAGESAGLRMRVDGREVVAEDVDQIRLVARPADARVLLGVESFPDAEAATKAVAGLGFPFVELGEGVTDLRRYIVRIPEAQRDQARATLLAAAQGTIDETDPKEGVSVFALTATYTAPASELELDGDAVVFPYGDNTTSPGYEVRDGALVERVLGQRPMRLPVSELSAVRVEKPVVVDPQGYLVEVGVDPASQFKWAILWLLVVAVMLTNGGVLVVTLRRRAS